jgi:hypothetical protein
VVAGKPRSNLSAVLAIVAIVFALRLPFLNQAIQGDDPLYLNGAEHAQIEPLHPKHSTYLFQGDLVDMRGHPHPPMNAWILAGLLAVIGDEREIPFHAAYLVFSIAAALAMWSIAKRLCEWPFLATLLFMAVPAFVVNGNSLEADIPFLAFWMVTIALFIKGIEERSRPALWGAAITSMLAALTAYQGIFLTAVLGAYLWTRQQRSIAAWGIAFVAPAALALWQIFEWSTNGAVPAAVMAGYMRTYDLQAFARKLRSATALLVHLGWIVSPLLAIVAAGRSRVSWILAGVAGAAAALYDPTPLFWISIAAGVLVIASFARKDFLAAWVLLFFAGAAMVFYAGSARYLLPIAAPVAIFMARALPPRVLVMGFALQMALSLGLAIINYQHWDAYREFARRVAPQLAGHRTWINAEWGLRWYLESGGGLAMAKGQVLAPGDMLVTSALALPLPVASPRVPIAEEEVRPRIPLRIISLRARSAFSAASGSGLLPFEIGSGPIDQVRLEAVVERKPELSYLDLKSPEAQTQIVSGVFPDGWMAGQATVVLRRPDQPLPLRASIYIPANAPARRVRLTLDGQTAADQTFPAPGFYTLEAMPVAPGQASVTIVLSVDKTFSAPPDRRELGIIVSAIGFR